MRVPLWLKIGWTLWLIVWAPLYWRQYGVQNFLFFCDIGNILIGIALWLESPLIFSWVASGLLVFQAIYTFDFAGALLTGHHAVGGTEYMFDPALPLTIRLLSLFHVATPPLLLWAIWRLGYNPRGWKLQSKIFDMPGECSGGLEQPFAPVGDPAHVHLLARRGPGP